MGINFKNSRILGSLMIVVVVLVVLGARLIQIQLVNHEALLAQSKLTDTYTVKVPASRGEIVDRNGEKLVTNRQGNSLIINAISFPTAKDNEGRNKSLQNLLFLLDRSGEADKVVKHLPLEQDAAGNIQFTADSEQEVKNMKSPDLFYLASYATPSDCYQAMVEKFSLASYSMTDALRIGNMRYELLRSGFSYSTPVVVAEDIKDETVLTIKGNHMQDYIGVEVRITAYREYVDGTIAPHLLGATTKMTAELYAQLKEKGYGLNDVVGESGIEQAMETYLRGIDGEMSVKVDEHGAVTSQLTKKPVQGRTIVLTIDKHLQKIAQDQLADVVAKRGTSGCVVVEDVKTGALLAAANYPTYDISTYRENYDALSKQSSLPMWNRFALGTYSPGSTFKPAMALAALETGAISESYIYNCGGSMQYMGLTFNCQKNKSHGKMNVRTALQESCNLFFYSCAERMGIQKMNEFSTDLGFGQKTGVEINETKGILSSKEYAESIGIPWTAGQVLLSAIGQAYNQFTLLQLASFTATIANDGTRYESHFVKQILSYDGSESISETKPKVLETLDLKTNALTVVKEGMRQVVTNGSAASLQNAVVPMSAKTGTAEVTTNGVDHTNGFLISYAPFDKPDIAIAAVVENATSGAYISPLEKAIVDAYYSKSEYVVTPQPFSQLLP